jgi:hypothetical protein
MVRRGDVFGRWTVLRYHHAVVSCGRVRHYLWCRCECGTKRAVLERSLYSCHSFSCGCYHKDKAKEANTTHGDRDRGRLVPEYVAWNNMINRCSNPKNSGYPNYGGRGITVDPDWYDYQNFIRDMGRRPSPQHSLDRIDNNGNYTKDNCRWTTQDVQRANRRKKLRRKSSKRGLPSWLSLFGQ